MKTDPKTTAGRAFVRSLNILLKFARLYGYEHVRTNEQLAIAWNELRTAIPEGSETGLLLGATGGQLLLDGVPLDGMPAEKQFALLLSSAGLASVQFTSRITIEELAKFVHAFPTGKAKPAELAQQLKDAIAGARGIRVNEVCFVATDSRLKGASVAAQMAAAALGDNQEQFKNLLNDPHQLLELIAAAEGSKASGEKGAGPGEGGAGLQIDTHGGSGRRTFGGLGSSPLLPLDTGRSRGPGKGLYAGMGMGGNDSLGKEGSFAPDEQEIFRILQAITTFGKMGTGQDAAAAAVEFQQQVTQLPAPAQTTLRDALAGLAAQGKNQKVDQSMLVQLAEHLAIQFALEQFERGEVKVDAVRQMLDRMNQEIEALRNILGQHEDKMSEAGILAETHREILDRKFWASVPEKAKREVLLSEEAWCIPPKNVQSYVGELIKHGELAEAISILHNYADCAESEEQDARKRTAVGLSELAGLYAQADPRLLGEALRHMGLRLSVEQDQDLQLLVSAAFVRLSQEAASQRFFPAMEQALELLAGVEAQRPGTVKTMRAKLGIEERVPEFVEEALRARQTFVGLTGVLKQLPQTSMEQLAVRFNRCQYREDLEQVANLAQELGDEALQVLRSTVRGGPIADAAEMVGLLAKLDVESATAFLPGRLKDFPRTAQDRIVRQIAAGGGRGGCELLLKILDYADPLVMPLVVDEIGLTGERDAMGRLLNIADGDLPEGAAPYLRVKAIEALGRLNAPECANTLKRIVEARKLFGWLNEQELRIAALQVLRKLEPDYVRDFLPRSGIEAAELGLAPLEVPQHSKFVRQRRHTRVRLHKSVLAVSTNLNQNCRLEIKTASMTGGLAATNMHLTPGTQVHLRMQVGMRNVQATAMMRDYRAQDMSFEIVDMGLDERAKFRKLLLENLAKGAA